MVLGICYKHELDMVPAPQAACSVVGEGKTASKQMFPIFTIAESPRNIGNRLPEPVIKR